METSSLEACGSSRGSTRERSNTLEFHTSTAAPLTFPPCRPPLSRFEYLINLPPDACVTEWATLDPRIFNFVVGTAVGSAKGIFGKDLTAEKQVFVIDAPADREGLFPSTARSALHKAIRLTSTSIWSLRVQSWLSICTLRRFRRTSARARSTSPRQ